MRSTTGWWFSLALLFAACQSQQVARPTARAAAPAAEPAADAAAAEAPADTFGFVARDQAAGGVAMAEPGAPTAAPEAERLLIVSGQVRVEVARPDEVADSFRAQVVAWGGHLQSQSDRTLVVRVPASRFEEAFQWVKSTGRVLGEARQAQDVTEEYLDIGIRLENARRARERLLEVLQKATAVEDILKVEAELRRLTEEIERLEGRQKFLADQVALATLAATFESIAEAPMARRARRPSRFDWINRVGAERVMEDF
ncbi:MAG: DUF4349 domain-containing protein [Planctomycetes bacterium]|nr:DUF4349 domain-containing protein [Planctomycetota bacterium]